MIAEFLFLNAIDYKFSFLIITHGPHQLDLLSFLVLRKKDLLNLSLVILDHLIGHMQNALGTAVVLFQLDHFHIVVIFPELQNILNGGSAERVNTLCIIPYHTNILVHGTQEFDYFVLGGVGILVLINQDVFEFMLVFGKGLRDILQQFIEFQ